MEEATHVNPARQGAPDDVEPPGHVRLAFTVIRRADPVFGDEERRSQLKESTNIFRVLIKTLLHAGIITQRTAPLYAVWVDMDELKAEGEGIPGDVVADEMLLVLREINAKRRRIGAKDVVAAS